MNTPRTKKPKRYVASPLDVRNPDGAYTGGIGDDQFAAALGQIASMWPHVEELMIHVFHDLLKIQDRILSGQIFRSIVNAHLRITMMRTALEESPSNQARPEFYDEVIDEFSKLNAARNTYLHGLWFTFDDGKYFCLRDWMNQPDFLRTDLFLSKTYRVS